MCFNSFYMSLNSLKRASNIEISSQLTGDVNIDTPQKVNIDALKLKMIKQENIKISTCISRNNNNHPYYAKFCVYLKLNFAISYFNQS